MQATFAETGGSIQANGITELDLYLNRLLPAHREVIELVDFALKSIEEASEIIGIPHATTKTRLFYARKSLVDALKYQSIDRVAA